jgi:hypothetical protein
MVAHHSFPKPRHRCGFPTTRKDSRGLVVPGRTRRVRWMGRWLTRGRRRCGARHGLGHRRRLHRYRGAGHGLSHGRLLDHGLRAAAHGLGRARHGHRRPWNGHGFSRAGASRYTPWSANDRPRHTSHSTRCRPGWPRHGLSLRDRRLLRLPARGSGGLPDCIVEPTTDQALREESQRRDGHHVGGYTRHGLPPMMRLKKTSPRAATSRAVFWSRSNMSA